jgi:methyl-accepting chemotaxis protein
LEEKSRLAVQDLTAAAAISSRHPGVQLGTVLAHGPRIAIGLFILFILSALLFFTLNRTLIKPLQHIHGWLDQSAIDVTKTAVSLSRSSRSLARGASDNTKAVLDAISSLDVLLNTAKRNAGHAGQAKELMDRAKSFVDAAHLTMQQISAAMEEIKNSGQASSQIVKTVDEIAFQTNILALNAAVEAARAGEAGVGFAVVADEVRNLANSSSAAAKSTTSMLESSLERIQEGADLVRKAEESFESLVTTSDEAAALMRGITEDSQSQTRDIQDVHQSIALMDKVTQENSLEAAEAGNISSELNRQAELLNKTISQVARVVSGRRAGLSGVRRGNFGQARPREGSAGSAGRAGVSKAPGERSGGAAAAAGKQGEVPGSFIDQILSEEKQHSSLPTKAFGKPKRSDLEKALPMDDDF